MGFVELVGWLTIGYFVLKGVMKYLECSANAKRVMDIREPRHYEYDPSRTRDANRRR